MQIALISDIHEDIAYLEKALAKIALSGAEVIICLGDISGYSHTYYNYESERDLASCLDLIRERCAMIIPGNHDLHLTKRLPAYSEAFDFPENWYELDIETRAQLSGGRVWLYEDEALQQARKDQVQFLSTLPEYQVFQIGELRILFSHYVYPDISGAGKKFYKNSRELNPHFNFLKEQNCSISFVGHGHSSGSYRANRKRFHEPVFGPIRLKGAPLILGIPPICRNGNHSGFAILDTNEMLLNTIPLQS